MLQRTNGRLLITLLVVTGLAGTLNNNSVSQQERKVVLEQLKTGKKDLLNEIKDLSDKQLSYVSPSTGLSVRKCMFQAAQTEKTMWEILNNAVKGPANPEKRLIISFTDNDLVERVKEGKLSPPVDIIFKQANAPWNNITAAVTDFKDLRSDRIKYMRTSTEDLRNHVLQTSFGWIDCYQYILVITAETNRYIEQIKAIKSEKKFPRK
ncbi:MAG: hypothetical protein IPN39_14960 [Chitinophagaceae bacterium]|nr:hypothetical protein [Chitinophagaceae bacterium]MBL0305646.1 hypothetical protein [Chitinophagaceae bacterium]HQV60138.1 hypothetical protein [Chitinophagaceae bacterium]HQV84918.1 hypothetical protein [Chitinophagaceae bacterium]HQX72008.1 hypothetical protein [Chitinophagaceae bacterium]